MLRYRPVSPHLTVYNAQSSSVFSIWHRITGITNFLSLFFSFLTCKLFIWGFKINVSFISVIGYALLKYLVITSYILFLYHVLNGYRHLTWDVNLFLTPKAIHKSAILIVIILFGIFSYSLIFNF